jgi:hypothetical protein
MKTNRFLPRTPSRPDTDASMPAWKELLYIIVTVAVMWAFAVIVMGADSLLN